MNHVRHVENHPLQEVVVGYIFVQKSDTCVSPSIEVIYMSEKRNTLIIIYCVAYVYFGTLHSKSVIVIELCLGFASNFFLSVRCS